jgi:hypothetical protein
MQYSSIPLRICAFVFSIFMFFTFHYCFALQQMVMDMLAGLFSAITSPESRIQIHAVFDLYPFPEAIVS